MSKTTSPDVAVMAALIEQYAKGWRGAACERKSAVDAAEALWACGYRKTVEAVDEGQNDRLSSIETRLSRIEGWSGMPPYYEPPNGR